MAQRQQKRGGADPGEGADEGSERAEDESTVATSGTERAGEAVRVGGIGEMPQPPREQSSEEEGERRGGGASDELRTMMVGM